MTEAAGTASIESVTDLHRDPARMTLRVEEAAQAADAAARAANVQVREISSLNEFDAVNHLYAEIWRPDPRNPPMTSELLRAFSKAGNYVAGAFDGDELLGACVGFFGAPAEETLHSHIAGVSGAARGRNVGFAMKLHQRAWSMMRGLSVVAWTFDPLVRRNAYFNLVKLAARPEEYLANFYGSMRDAINGGDDSDRLLVHWRLDDPLVVAACLGTTSAADAQLELASGAVIALSVSARGGPAVGALDALTGLDARTFLVAIPADIEALRAGDPGCAKDWRIAVRETLGAMITDGARVTGFDPAGHYVLRRREPAIKDGP
jgi:predicted GNAT superfamily acetyltransferase